jgi:hypothetical protein
LSRLYFGRFLDVHIGGPSSNQATSLESQMIHLIQLLPGRTLSAARLLTSLMIGFLAGLAATLALGIDKLLFIDPSKLDILLGIAAAGYVGTDFIEGFMSRFAPTRKPSAPVVKPTESVPEPAVVSRLEYVTPAALPVPAAPTPAPDAVVKRFLDLEGLHEADLNLPLGTKFGGINAKARLWHAWKTEWFGYPTPSWHCYSTWFEAQGVTTLMDFINAFWEKLPCS